MPLLLDTDTHKDGPRPFLFENMWLRHHSLKKNVEIWWSETTNEVWAGLRLQKKLSNLKNQLKDWNKNIFGIVSKRKEELLQVIQDLDKQEANTGLSEELKFDRNHAKDDFQELAIKRNLIGVKNLMLIGFETGIKIQNSFTP